MIEPDIHPHADDLKQALIDLFGDRSTMALQALTAIAANVQQMKVIEALCFVHQSTYHDADKSDRAQHHREGRRAVALDIAAAKSISIDEMKEALNARGYTRE
jgi:hypothetical protein